MPNRKPSKRASGRSSIISHFSSALPITLPEKAFRSRMLLSSTEQQQQVLSRFLSIYLPASLLETSVSTSSPIQRTSQHERFLTLIIPTQIITIQIPPSPPSTRLTGQGSASPAPQCAYSARMHLRAAPTVRAPASHEQNNAITAQNHQTTLTPCRHQEIHKSRKGPEGK